LIFNSFQFIVFLPIVVMLYFALPHKWRWALLLAASYYFYMVWKPEYIVLIIVSTLIDYSAGLLMEKTDAPKKRKALLLLSLLTNLGLLFVFKYFNFFSAQLGHFFTGVLHKPYSFSGLNVLLPMGISFYTFQTLSYTIDVYRKARKAEHHLGYFALYVTFFPQLVAGPIERSEVLLPQLKQKHSFSYERTMNALMRIGWGMFKKVVIADRVGALVNVVYNDLSNFQGVYLILATIGFAFQIYCDFSAYSDIAIGSASLMGIEIMENFKMPYFSKSISEFWRRWHISLSTWFRDYLYIPLGGNRMKKEWLVYRNLFIVFLVSGFWHGAAWTFLVWGALHGIYQMIEKSIRQFKKNRGIDFKLPDWVNMGITFFLVLLSWVFFRANSLSDALYVISHATLDATRSFGYDYYAVFGMGRKEIAVLFAAVFWLAITDWIKYKKNVQVLIKNYFWQGIFFAVLVVAILVFGYYGTLETSEFIYFQF